jgi:hypothetical protein
MQTSRPSPLEVSADRRSWWAVPFLVLVVAGLALAAATEVGAIKNWCRTDPVVAIDGELADIFVAAPVEAPTLVTGPNEVVVIVPRGVPARVILNDLGFGKGTETAVEESRALRETEHGIEVVIKVRVPARDDDMPVRVEFAPRVVGILWPESAEGVANEWITLRTEF